jgi:phenylalanyl-tRNA synthetase alpha chain
MLHVRCLPFGLGVAWPSLRISVLRMVSTSHDSYQWFRRSLSSETPAAENTRFKSPSISILGDTYKVDSLTNVTPRVANKVDHRLHRRPGHPLYHVRRRIENYFNSSFVTRVGTPRFAIFDSISPIVTPLQNFDSLLVPSSHPSRSPSDTYYINSEHLLRSHTTAHDADLIRSGLDAFLTIGDVYRRDEIDASHYPVFHQVDGVLLFSQNQVTIV